LLTISNRGQRRIEEFEDRLKDEENRRDEAKARMEYTNKLLVQVKSDIEHLANKLQSLKAVGFAILVEYLYEYSAHGFWFSPVTKDFI
jgi:hypothetical protein